MFDDRADAGRKLLARLREMEISGAVVIALPRGGLPVAEVIARGLDAPLEIALVRKIGMPGEPEFAAGAVTDAGGVVVTVNPEALAAGLTPAAIHMRAKAELPELRRRRALYQGARPPLDLTGRTVIVVDDGIATGATMRAVLRLLRAGGAGRLVMAVPVAPRDALADLAPEADATVCLQTPAPFYSVGMHYRDFAQLEDAEVTAILARNRRRLDAASPKGDGPGAATNGDQDR